MHEFKFDTDEFQLEGDIDSSTELQIADVLSEWLPSGSFLFFCPLPT